MVVVRECSDASRKVTTSFCRVHCEIRVRGSSRDDVTAPRATGYLLRRVKTCAKDCSRVFFSRAVSCQCRCYSVERRSVPIHSTHFFRRRS